MWFDPSDPATITQQRIRHEAQQGDQLDRYGWVRHDGRSYGRQELLDGDFQLSVQMVSSGTVQHHKPLYLSCYLPAPCARHPPMLQAVAAAEGVMGHCLLVDCCQSVLQSTAGQLVHANGQNTPQTLPRLPCVLNLQVKSSSADSGYGGDWSVRVKAELSEAGKGRQRAAKEAAEAAGRKAHKRKLSLLFYFADAHWRTGEVEVLPHGQQTKLGEVHTNCSSWQMTMSVLCGVV